jgi:hypothetical protein
MALLKMVALGALGYVGYKYLQWDHRKSPAAFADEEDASDNFSKVRSAGPTGMADPPRANWSKIDQRSDESFPASDPPSTY